MDKNREEKTLKLQKADLRQQAFRRRKELSYQYCRQADQVILERLLALEEYIQAETVFTYVSMEGEADTRELIVHSLAAGKTVAVPRCTGKGIMKAYRIKGMEDLEPGAYGILEPKEDCPEIEPEQIQLAVVPCLACSPEGVRLGYGGGYYDRYLSRCLAFRVLLCYEQMMLSCIPVERHDCRMDVIITENLLLSGL